jgi:hypothetical protein
VGTNGLESSGLEKIIDKYEPSGILYVDSAPFTKMGLSYIKYFSYVREHNGVPSCLSTPMYKWSSSSEYKKGEGPKSIIGFNLKHLTWVAQGNNGFEDYSHLFKDFPIRIVKTLNQFKKMYYKLKKADVVCCDIEGKGLKLITNTVYTVQFGIWEKGRIVTYVLPWKHRDHVWNKKHLRLIKRGLVKLFSDEKKEFVFHSSSYDVGQLCHITNMDVFPAPIYDTISGIFAEDENWKFLDKIYRSTEWSKGYFSPYSLETLEHRHNLFRPGDILEKDDRTNMSRFSLDEIATYGAYDVVSPLIIRKQQIQRSTSKWVGYKTKKDYLNLVLYQLGVMQKTFSLLNSKGIHIDRSNLAELTKKNNVFIQTVDRITKELLNTKHGKKANRLILRKNGIEPSGGLFSTEEAIAFSMTKPAHRQMLFFKVMKLEATSIGKSGDPSTNKAFQNKYKDIEEVKLFSHFNKVRTLKSNFADSINKITKNDEDYAVDGRLRSIFSFIRVLTGRLSTQPNTQNIPSRSDADFEIHKDLVKAIKKLFSVAPGRVMLGSDFSAHEVRMSGDIAKDKAIRQAFLAANEAIRKYRLAPDKFVEAAAKILAREGDIHIINVRFFFKQDIDKSHPLRYKIKAIVFGVLYGKMAKGLAKELKIEESEAQSLIDIMFERWHSLDSWIHTTHDEGKNNFMIHYPNNRIRHLWAYMHEDIWAHRAMDRRGVNSVIQGFSSDIGVVAVDTYKMWVHKNITKNGFNFDAFHTNIVHDAQYSDVLYEHLPFAIYLTEHSMSTLPMDYYKDKFDYEISIPLSYGLEFGKDWGSLEEWNFRVNGYDSTKEKDGKTSKTYVPGLLDMIRDEGKRVDKPYDEVIKDTKFIMGVRQKELEKNPYKMLVNSKTIDKVFDKMYMFRKQLN